MGRVLSPSAQGVNPLGIDYLVRYAKRRYGHVLAIDAFDSDGSPRIKDLFKFAEGVTVKTDKQTIQVNAGSETEETYINHNGIDSFSSSSAADVGLLIGLEGAKCGDDIAVSSITRSGNTVTVVTDEEHGRSAGQWMNIRGADQQEYNGLMQLLDGADAPTPNSFKFRTYATPASPATGTIITNHPYRTFVFQNVVANGQSRVALSTSLCRSTRGYVAEQSRAAPNQGVLYIFQNQTLASGIPTEADKVHLVVSAGKGQSDKAASFLEKDTYFLITDTLLTTAEKSATSVEASVYRKRLGGVFRPILPGLSASNAHGGFRPIGGGVRFMEPNDDFLVKGSSSSAGGVPVSAEVSGYLLRVASPVISYD